MREPSPYKRQRGPHDIIDESDPTKRARHDQPNLLDTSWLHEPSWLTPTPPSVPSHGNSVSPFAFSDSGCPFLPPFDPHTSSYQVQEGAVNVSSNENDCCCFGEILIDFMSSATLDQDNTHVPVELRFSAGTIKLYVEGSNKYVGLLDSKAIADLVQTYEVTLTATLSCSATSRNKPSAAIQTPKTLHVVVYGLRKDMDGIGDFLEDFSLFLQHPTEYDSRREYLNPQYLLQPGSSMPRIEDAAFHALPSKQSSDRTLDEKSKGEVHQIFDSASGPALFSQIPQSPRLRTTLKDHQQKALAMMTEKDCGRIDKTIFPSLWEAFTESNGDIRPKDMGLGKTLSTLGLIAWFLDLIDNGYLPEPCRTTLIIAPNSTIPGWQEQINRHTFTDQVRVTLYHGPLRDQIANSLTEYDIVLTTYGTLQSEWKLKNGASPLFSNTWARVVLDEGERSNFVR
ncbi:Helicase C-terminal [Fusarium albosuccineum]|uniref:Helicase C-terminal n=1 Tax=Fusarium albosuccineum TaxID=1237068 RepID=A0A8H4LBM2_9HYPO|nr:Helicase C-terminal [Fusarium albosuccineum]